MNHYDLSILEPAEFENLVADLITARENTIQKTSYIVTTQNSGPDGGVDFKLNNGKIIGQAKRYKNKNDLLRNLRREVEKVKRLSPERYILIVSLEISYDVREKIKKLFYPYIKSDSDIIDLTDVRRLLETHRDILLQHNRLWLSGTHILQQVIGNTIDKSINDFTDLIKKELGEIIGVENINKLPELPELFEKVNVLNQQITAKKKELENCKKALIDESTYLTLLELLHQKIRQEYEDLSQTLTKTKATIEELAQRIKRQKDFLDKMDQQEVSERMQKAKTLFEEGNFAAVNALLSYEGRENDIYKKLEEKTSRSAEWALLANEEAFIALTLLQEKEWRQNISKIKLHFEQSIELGGYRFNAYQYSFFLEEIGDHIQAIDILKKAVILLPIEEIENRALTWKRLGDLLSSTDEKKALKAYEKAVIIYENLFEEAPHKYEYRIMLATVQYHCGSILVHQSSEQARAHLEHALLLLSNLEQRGNIVTLRLTFIVTISLSYVHQQLGNIQSTGSYSIIAAEIGGTLAMLDPDVGVFHLLEAINRLRKLLGEENTVLIYNRVLNYYLKFRKQISLTENYHHAKQLINIGVNLLTVQETIGAEICFRSALNNFKTLEKLNHLCSADIVDTLDLVGFIYLTKNNSSAAKRVLLEAKNTLSRVATKKPKEHLPKMASILDKLYLYSFIAVSPSQYWRAYHFFDEALEIYKHLDKEYNQLNIDGCKQLLQYRATMISKGLDKTDLIVFYQELCYLRNRIMITHPDYDNKWFYLSIHELGELLLKDLHIDHVFFDSISKHIIEAATSLFEKEPDKYSRYLVYVMAGVGKILSDGHQYEKASTYLRKAILLLKDLASKEPLVNENAIVMPMFTLAYCYTQLNDYCSALPYFIDLCHYFESRLYKNPEFLTILVSFMLSTTEVLIFIEQKEKALEYIARAQAYIPIIPDKREHIRLKESFKNLENKLY